MAPRNNKANPLGHVTFVLHSHLPYVVNHGTWPHGMEWLHEAAAETYLPLLRVFGELEEQGLALKANVNLSPVLLEQLAHPVFKDEFPKYLLRKIKAAAQDAEDFNRDGDHRLADVARWWQRFYEQALRQFDELRSDIIRGFKRFYDSGAIEIITCGATHGYFPLLGTDASVRAQVQIGVATHKRYFGRRPRGIWLPECGYRPAGPWRFPVPVNGLVPTAAAKEFFRDGVEQVLAENELEFFFVDTHLVDSSTRFTPYQLLAGDVPVAMEECTGPPKKNFYRAYYADTPDRKHVQVAFFTRDPRTGIQVWSGEHGYPGDGNYLEFHKKRWPGGHRYWRITGPKADLGDKQQYYPSVAASRVAEHASHFAGITTDVLRKYGKNGAVVPVLTAPFDAELFGHWWFEGPEWLKCVAMDYGSPSSQVSLISCAEYLDRYSPSAFVQLPEGSWGAESNNSVWLNENTAWTWKHIYAAEVAVQQMANSGGWQGDPIGTRLANQICRELLLLESSDWQFLITTLHARDYAEKRFNTHLEQFRELLDTWRRYESTHTVSEDRLRQLEAIEQRDSIFPDVRPDRWATSPQTAALAGVTVTP